MKKILQNKLELSLIVLVLGIVGAMFFGAQITYMVTGVTESINDLLNASLGQPSKIDEFISDVQTSSNR